MDDSKLIDAVRLLTEAGAVFSLPVQRHYSLGTAADQLDCGKTWLRQHLSEFPNAWRMPGGELRVSQADIADAKRRAQSGELRIPAKDIEALAVRGRLQRKVKP